MRIDPQRLSRLAVLIDHGNFSRAAGHLGLTQPALSLSIAQIEKEVGVRLIERSPHGVLPTVYGQALYEYAKKIDRELAAAGQKIQELAFGNKGTLSIGTTVGGAASLAALAICRLQQSQPGITIRIKDDTSITSLLADLHDRTVDMLVCQHPKEDEIKGTRSIALFRANRVACVRAGHPLKENISLNTLWNYPFICPEEELGLLFGLRQIFSTRGLDMPEVLVTSSIQIAKEIVLNSDTFALFSDLSVLNERKMGLMRLVELENPIQYWMELVLREEQVPTDIAKSFVEKLLEVCEELDIQAHPDASKFRDLRTAVNAN